MIKINTPNDVIVQEIEKDNFLVDFINNINNKLSVLENFPTNGLRFEIVTESRLTVRQKNLLMYIFSIHGWSLSINFIGETKEDEVHYNVFIIEQKKIYLN